MKIEFCFLKMKKSTADTQLSKDEKFITKTLTWPKLYWAIKSLFSNYNMIYVLHGNTVGKSVDWTELYEFSLTVKKDILCQKHF